MSSRMATRGLVLAAAICALPLVAAAQDEAPQRGGGYGYLLDNVDLLLDNYTRLLVRKYDLTEEQDAFTHEIIRERAHQFLDQHKPELRALVDELFEVRSGGEMAPEELIAWGKRALPLYNEAKMLIVEGNAEWREVLNEEQRRKHDEDLAQMHEGFRNTEEQLERIVTGQMTVDEFRTPKRWNRKSDRPRSRADVSRPPQTKRDIPEPAAPTGRKDVRPPAVSRSEPERRVAEPRPRPTPPRSTDSPRPNTRGERSSGSSRPPKVGSAGGDPSKDVESKWEAYVREFIQKYSLNDEQTQRALAILKDCQQKAEQHMKAREGQLKKLDRLIVEMKDAKPKSDAVQLRKLSERRAALLAPIEQIFERQLKPRLEKLPTSAQRRAAESAAKSPNGSRKRAGKDGD